MLPVVMEREAQVTDARQLRSRRALTGALLALLDEKPFDQITIREITARAGTGYATFFRHYADREALLSDIAGREIAELLAMTAPMLRDVDSLEATRALCQFVDDHRQLWTALLTGGAAGIVRDEFIRQARFLPRDAPAPQEWLPSDLAVVHGAGGTIDLLAWWLSDQGEGRNAANIAAILHRLIIAPLVGREPR